ncbi:hypothetical protein H1R20_g14367, partial [Candolleomyces eurysporus]
MIILDGDRGRDKIDSPFVGQTVRLPDRVTLRLTTSLPDYDASQQEHEVSQEPEKKKRRFDSSFWRAVVCSLVIYVALSLAIAVPLVVVRKEPKNKPRPKPPPGPPGYSLWSSDDATSPLPLQSLRESLSGHAVRCNVWDIAEDSSSNPLLLSTSQYKLPPQGLITVRSNISYDSDIFSGINGSLAVNLNQDKKEKNVLFIVNVLSSTRAVRDLTNVCFTDTGPNRGLTIYAPKELDSPDATLSFAIQVLLPVSVSIETFKTYLPLFSQTFGELRPQVWFDRLTIEGTNNFISCGKLAGSHISVKNVLANVQGSFNVTDRLTLDTVRGWGFQCTDSFVQTTYSHDRAISANIILTQTPSCLQPSFLSMDTGYSPISANITLATTAPGNAEFQPSFVTQVKTFNGGIDVDILHDKHTPSSSLSLQVQNALAESNVRLDSKFEGMFNVQTKLDQVTIRNGTISRGGGKSAAKERVISFDQRSPGRAMGWVGWGQRQPQRTFGQGRIEIVSSLSPITLDLG